LHFPCAQRKCKKMSNAPRGVLTRRLLASPTLPMHERMKLPALNRLNLALFAALTLWEPCARAQSDALAEPRLMQKLRQPVTLTWRGQTLGVALERLSDSQQLPVWLDRRVDPGAAVDFAASDEPSEQVLSRLAASHGLAATPFQSLIYFGPRETADELATLSVRCRDSLAKAAPAVRARWLKAAAWSYPRLSEPRRLLRETLDPMGVALIGEEQVPHDLWPARSTPPLAALDRVLLILAGFDLTCELSPSGNELRVISIKRPVEITRLYPARQKRIAAFEQTLSTFPPQSVRERGEQLEISARWEDHQRLRAAIHPSSPQRQPVGKPADLQTKRFTLKIEKQPVDRVVDQLARQLNLNVVWSSNPPRGEQAIISCDVRQVDLDGLLDAILAPAGFASARDGQTVTIRPAK